MIIIFVLRFCVFFCFTSFEHIVHVLHHFVCVCAAFAVPIGFVAIVSMHRIVRGSDEIWDAAYNISFIVCGNSAILIFFFCFFFSVFFIFCVLLCSFNWCRMLVRTGYHFNDAHFVPSSIEPRDQFTTAYACITQWHWKLNCGWQSWCSRVHPNCCHNWWAAFNNNLWHRVESLTHAHTALTLHTHTGNFGHSTNT